MSFKLWANRKRESNQLLEKSSSWSPHENLRDSDHEKMMTSLEIFSFTDLILTQTIMSFLMEYGMRRGYGWGTEKMKLAGIIGRLWGQ